MIICILFTDPFQKDFSSSNRFICTSKYNCYITYPKTISELLIIQTFTPIRVQRRKEIHESHVLLLHKLHEHHHGVFI